jgi:transcriptional regulator with XRE-family HTH domain
MRENPLDNYLRTERRQARLSQEDIAFLLGSRDGAKVSRYERGRRLPSLETALSYEAILGIPVRELFLGIFQKVDLEVKARVRILEARQERASDPPGKREV